MTKITGMAAGEIEEIPSTVLYDRYLVGAALGLIVLGLLMVYSSSIVMSDRIFGQPFHFLLHQVLYLSLGLVSAFFIVRVDLKHWQAAGPSLLLLTIFLLTLVLVPGLGRQVNGSNRWLGF